MNDEANYAQDDPAFAPYITDAAAIVEGLRHGDETELVRLPEQYQESLRARMAQRLNELQEEAIGRDEFDLEITKMVSVACIGLREVAEGI